MDDQLSIGSTDLSFAPFRQWNKHIGNVIVNVEFDPFWKNVDNVETIGIANNCQHYCFRLDGVLFSRELFIRWQPDGLVICIQKRPELIKGYDLKSRSALLGP
jgi:hypothetical protein